MENSMSGAAARTGNLENIRIYKYRKNRKLGMI